MHLAWQFISLEIKSLFFVFHRSENYTIYILLGVGWQKPKSSIYGHTIRCGVYCKLLYIVVAHHSFKMRTDGENVMLLKCPDHLKDFHSITNLTIIFFFILMAKFQRLSSSVTFRVLAKFYIHSNFIFSPENIMLPKSFLYKQVAQLQTKIPE